MNILSFDGGGARGIITIKLIKEIIDRANQITQKNLHIIDLFDFYCGSSVGTLIIAALLIPDPTQPTKPKYNIDDVTEIMIKQCHSLFETTFWQNVRTLWGFWLPKYTNDTRIPMYHEIFTEIEFGELLGTIVFPVGDTISNRPIYLHNTQANHQSIKVTDILLGTTAAPTYFPSKNLIIDGKETNLIDSGCVANNTSQLAFVEAMNLYKNTHPVNSLYELSIGTGQVSTTYDSQWWGVYSWLPRILSTLMDFNSENQDYELSLIADSDQIDRIDPSISHDLNYLDKPQYIPQYIELTEQWIKNNNSKLDLIVKKILINKGLLDKNMDMNMDMNTNMDMDMDMNMDMIDTISSITITNDPHDVDI
jgi:patatin-like phospholipase/acyl hydrolase